jgi:hypothetical protein
MQEVKLHLLSLGILKALETICYDGWTDEFMDEYMDGWIKAQFRMGQINMNKTRYAPTK